MEAPFPRSLFDLESVSIFLGHDQGSGRLSTDPSFFLPSRLNRRLHPVAVRDIHRKEILNPL